MDQPPSSLTWSDYGTLTVDEFQRLRCTKKEYDENGLIPVVTIRSLYEKTQ